MVKTLNLSYDIGKTKQILRFFYFSLQSIFILLTFALAAALVAKNIKWSGVNFESTPEHAAFNATLALSVFLILPFVFQFVLIFVKKIPGQKFIDWALSGFNGLFILFVVVTAALVNGYTKIWWNDYNTFGTSAAHIQLLFQISAALLSFAVFAMISQVGFLSSSTNSRVSIVKQDVNFGSNNATYSEKTFAKEEDYDTQTLKIKETSNKSGIFNDIDQASTFYDVDLNRGYENRYTDNANSKADDNQYSENIFARDIKWASSEVEKGAKDVLHGTEDATKWAGSEVEKGAKDVLHGTEDVERKTVSDIEYIDSKADQDLKDLSDKSFKAINPDHYDDNDEVVYGTHRVDDLDDSSNKRSKKVKDFEIKDFEDLDF